MNMNKIVVGKLPSSVAELESLDLAVSAHSMQKDVVSILQRIQEWTGVDGEKVVPEIDVKEHVILCIPPCLEHAAKFGLIQKGDPKPKDWNHSLEDLLVVKAMKILSDKEWQALASEFPEVELSPTVYFARVNGFHHLCIVPNGYVQKWVKR